MVCLVTRPFCGYQVQGHLSRSRSNIKVTIFKKWQLQGHLCFILFVMKRVKSLVGVDEFAFPCRCNSEVFQNVICQKNGNSNFVFVTVEKATVLARFIETDSIMQNKTVKTAFAHIFCLLIGSLEDINASVSQKTIQYLETIKYSSVKVIVISLCIHQLFLRMF